MKRRFRTAAWAALALPLWLVAQDGKPPLSIEASAGGLDLPMEEMGGRPLVEVFLEGKGPYRFILDTGADITVIDEDLAKQLSLSAGRVEALRLGEVTLRGVTVESQPLSNLLGSTDAPRGVLSAASFPGYLLVLDYPAKRIRIRKGDLPPADSRTRFEYTREQVLPNVPLRVAGVEVRAHVDTGSPGALMLPSRYRAELPLAAEATQMGLARTPHGEFPIWSGQIKGSVELGQYQLDLPDVQFSDVNPLPGPPTGNLGYRILRQFVVTLDSKNRRIQFDR